MSRVRGNRASWRAALCVVSWMLCSETPASADDASPELARQSFRRGYSAAREHRLSDAAQAFEEAARLWPAPAIYYNWAHVLYEMGLPIDAYRILHRIPLTTESTPEADDLRRSIAEEIGLLSIELVGSTDGVALELDASELSTEDASRAHPVVPGAHEVEIRVRGVLHRRQIVEIDAGERLRLMVELPPPAALMEPTLPPARKTSVRKTSMLKTPVLKTAPTADDAPRRRTRAWLWAASAGAVLVVAAGIALPVLLSNGSAESGPRPGGFNPGSLKW